MTSNLTNHSDIERHQAALDKPSKAYRSAFGVTVAQFRSTMFPRYKETVDLPAVPGSQVLFDRDSLCAAMFLGATCKPVHHYRYRNAQLLDDAIQAFGCSVEATAAHRSDRRTRKSLLRSVGHGWEVGQFLQGSWGYEQTNQEFWKVVEVRGNVVVAVPVGHDLVESYCSMSGSYRPNLDRVTGEPRRFVVQFSDHGPSVSLTSYCSLTAADPDRTYSESFYA